MEVCPKTELIAIEDPATVCDGSLEIGEGRNAQMIRHMRHDSSPGLMAPQPILSSNRRESLAIPSAGDRMTSSLAFRHVISSSLSLASPDRT